MTLAREASCQPAAGCKPALRPRASVLRRNRSLTVAALIGAPTVREGLPSRAQYYAFGGLV
jgi:hypothetical protein